MKTVYENEVIFCIVNSGYSEAVMEAAKEIVMIVVPSKIKDAVLHALYKEVGLESKGQGIAFSLPVDGVVGISADAPAKDKE